MIRSFFLSLAFVGLMLPMANFEALAKAQGKTVSEKKAGKKVKNKALKKEKKAVKAKKASKVKKGAKKRSSHAPVGIGHHQHVVGTEDLPMPQKIE